MSINDSDLIERLQAVADGFEMRFASPAADALRGRRRVRRNRALVTGAAAAAVAVVIGLTTTLAGQDRASNAPVEQPTQIEQSEQIEQSDTGIFVDVHGWLVYGDGNGIWAVDPGRPDQEQLVADGPGQPLGWSSDGTKLLIARVGIEGADEATFGLAVLNADGTETRVVSGTAYLGGSISPDGSHVIYSDAFSGKPGIYTVGADGGTPRLLHKPDPRPDPEPAPGEEPAMFDRETYYPVFSPDGSQIAYFDGHGDWGHRLRAMNADGTGSRTLYESEGHINGLAWASDGQRLIFGNDDGTWRIGIDGSGLTRMDVPGGYPDWSPDGPRVLFERARSLYLARADGTQATEISDAPLGWGSAPPKLAGARWSRGWNPLALERGEG